MAGSRQQKKRDRSVCESDAEELSSVEQPVVKRTGRSRAPSAKAIANELALEQRLAAREARKRAVAGINRNKKVSIASPGPSAQRKGKQAQEKSDPPTPDIKPTAFALRKSHKDPILSTAPSRSKGARASEDIICIMDESPLEVESDSECVDLATVLERASTLPASHIKTTTERKATTITPSQSKLEAITDKKSHVTFRSSRGVPPIPPLPAIFSTHEPRPPLLPNGLQWYEKEKSMDPVFATEGSERRFTRKYGLVQWYHHSADHLFPAQARKLGLRRFDPERDGVDPSIVRKLSSEGRGPLCFPVIPEASRDPSSRRCHYYCYLPAFMYTLPKGKVCTEAAKAQVPTIHYRWTSAQKYVGTSCLWCAINAYLDCPINKMIYQLVDDSDTTISLADTGIAKEVVVPPGFNKDAQLQELTNIRESYTETLDRIQRIGQEHVVSMTTRTQRLLHNQKVAEKKNNDTLQTLKDRVETATKHLQFAVDQSRRAHEYVVQAVKDCDAAYARLESFIAMSEKSCTIIKDTGSFASDQKKHQAQAAIRYEGMMEKVTEAMKRMEKKMMQLEDR